MIKHVTQEDDTGCGIACLAMLTRKTYNEIKTIIIEKKFKKSEKNLRTNYSEIIRIGLEFNLNLNKRKKFNKWSEIPSTSIVSTDFSLAKRNWHWVVFVKEVNKKPYLLDPFDSKSKGGKKRFDFRGKKCGSYMLLLND